MTSVRGTDSRCCTPVQRPRIWVDHVDRDNPAVRSFEAWLNSLKPFARLHEVGVIADLFEAAAMGHLQDTGDATTPIKPIRSDPEVFELRCKALLKQLRFYHAEPEAYPDALIALHKHLKDAATQQQEIDFAVNRFR